MAQGAEETNRSLFLVYGVYDDRTVHCTVYWRTRWVPQNNNIAGARKLMSSRARDVVLLFCGILHVFMRPSCKSTYRICITKQAKYLLCALWLWHPRPQALFPTPPPGGWGREKSLGTRMWLWLEEREALWSNCERTQPSFARCASIDLSKIQTLFPPDLHSWWKREKKTNEAANVPAPYHSRQSSGSFSMVVTISSPWRGGFDHIGRIRHFMCSRMWGVVSGFDVTIHRFPTLSSAVPKQWRDRENMKYSIVKTPQGIEWLRRTSEY